MNTSYKLLDDPEEGCAKGKILNSDEDHNLFAEFGLYSKSPLTPRAEPRLEPALEGVNEAEINVQAAAAVDPAATGLAAVAAPPTAANAMATFAALL